MTGDEVALIVHRDAIADMGPEPVAPQVAPSAETDRDRLAARLVILKAIAKTGWFWPSEDN